MDESGNPLRNVSVQACYSGWGFSQGSFVWDKDYCSEITQTNHDGSFVISFNGPDSSRLTASREGWIQTEDYNTTHSRIVLTRSEDYALRLKAEAEKREIDNRKYLPDESEKEYYCRVILSEVRPVRLNYQDEIIIITPVLLENNLQNRAVFALKGSAGCVNSFSDEVVIKINGENSGNSVSIESGGNSCGTDTHFISVIVSGLYSASDIRIEILIPSINAMFDMKIWEI